jgi:hypothetical protein
MKFGAWPTSANLLVRQAVSELRLLINKPLKEWGKALDGCRLRVHECAKDDLNPRITTQARRIANRAWQFLKSYR